MNLFLFTASFFIYATFYAKYLDSTTEHESWKYAYFYLLSRLISDIVSFYVDLFLLWLLYRFMRPQESSTDGWTAASIVLFVHDAKSADKSLLDSYR